MNEEIEVRIDKDVLEELLAHFEQVGLQPDALPLTPKQCVEMLIQSVIGELAVDNDA